MSVPDVNDPADALGCLAGLVVIPALVIFIAVVPVLLYKLLPFIVAIAVLCTVARRLYVHWRDKRDLML